MQARILIIGGILEKEQKDALDAVIKKEDIQTVFTHYLSGSQTKNGKKLKSAVLDKYDVWVFKTAPTPIDLSNMLDESEKNKIIFVPIYEHKKFTGYQKIINEK